MHFMTRRSKNMALSLSVRRSHPCNYGSLGRRIHRLQMNAVGLYGMYIDEIYLGRWEARREGIACDPHP